MAALFWRRLHTAIEGELARADAVMGISLRDLSGGHAVHIHGDELFPTASTIKMHVLTALLQLADAGTLDLSQRIHFAPREGVGGSGILAYLEDGVTLTLLDAAVMMIALSDNTATNACIDAAGLDRVNALITQLGLTRTRFGRKMMDGARMQGQAENVATPNELTAFLTRLHRGQPSAAVAARALALLRKPKESFIGQAVPDGIAVANKAGWVDGVRCDAAIVSLPRRPYAVAIMAKYGTGLAHELDMAMVRLARVVHAHMTVWDESNPQGHRVYRPGSPFNPGVGPP